MPSKTSVKTAKKVYKKAISTKKKAVPKFSLRKRVYSLAAVVAVAGTLFILNSHLPVSHAATTGVQTVEAENMTLSTTAGVTVENDSVASGGKDVSMVGATTMTSTTQTGQVQEIRVTARGDKCGDTTPNMQVKLDGALIGSKAVDATTWTDYSFPAAVPAGSHKLEISFTNPYAAYWWVFQVCAATLHVDKADYSVITSTPAPSPSPTPAPTSTPTPTPSPSPSTTPDVTAVEAETMNKSTTTGVTNETDSLASGGSAVNMTANATLSTTNITGGIKELRVTAKGDQCTVTPTMQVSLDGVVVGNVAVTATAWTVYTIPVTAAAGSHKLEISFTNASTAYAWFWPTCSNGLHVDKAEYAASPRPLMVSLGDSYSAGVGSDKTPTDPSQSVYDGTNCYRSFISAAHLLANARGYALTDVSCSGATADNILNTGMWNEPPQINSVNSSTSVVTLTIGGNDTQILSFIQCASGGECNLSNATVQQIDANITAVKSKIQAVLSAITSRAPNATVLIAGYPPLLPLPGWAVGNCTWMSADEQTAWNYLLTRQNDAARNAAAAIGGRVKYVDPLVASSPFMQTDNGLHRDACSTSNTRGFNGPNDAPAVGAWHPNKYGYQHYFSLYNANL